MSTLGQTRILSRRAVSEMLRTPEALAPTLFIPLFFLLVNVGQAAKVFPSSTPFLHGQGYAAFQLPLALLTGASFGSAALFLIEDLDGGYFDKLRATPISRTALVLGRLVAEALKSVVLTTAMILVSLLFGVRISSGIGGLVLLLLLVSLWAVAFSGLIQVLALKTRSAAATQGAGMIFFPLVFLTPSLVPRDQLAWPMEIAATVNPVTYIMEALRSLILDARPDAVVAGFGVALGVLVLAVFLNVRTIVSFD